MKLLFDNSDSHQNDLMATTGRGPYSLPTHATTRAPSLAVVTIALISRCYGLMLPLSLTHCMHTIALGVASISFEDEGSFLYRRSNKLPEIMARLLIKSTDRSQECNYYGPPTHQFVIICTHKLKNRCCNLSRYRRIGLQEEVPISHAMNAFRS